MQIEHEPAARRKKSFRARGSRGGARRKRDGRNNQNHQNHQNHQMSYQNQHQYYNSGYSAPHASPHPHQFQHNHHQQQYYYNHGNPNQMGMNHQHRQHAPTNTGTYASMAYTQDIQVQHSQSWGSNTVSSKDTGDLTNNENYNPEQDHTSKQRDSILPNLPPKALMAASTQENANERPNNFAILPMQRVDQNYATEKEHVNSSDDSFLKRSPSTISLQSEKTNELLSSIEIPDLDLIDRAVNQPSNDGIFSGTNARLDLFSTMHPIFNAKGTNATKFGAISNQNENDRELPSFLTGVTIEAGGSYFETSPRSFLLGKKQSKTSFA